MRQFCLQTLFALFFISKSVEAQFRKEESAVKAKRAIPDELTFYGQQMSVSPYVSSGGRKRTSSINSTMSTSLGDDGLPNEASSTVVGAEGRFSRSSSMQSVASIGALSSSQQIPCALLLDELPTRVLERIFQFLDPVDRICLERVNKKWLEAAAKAWSNCHCLSFQQDGGHSDAARFQFFSKKNPLRNSHLRAFIQRCGLHLKLAMESFDVGPQSEKPQIIFRTLRRLHGHNLENRGLNNLSEAFQSFMTRAKFFSIGRMRRTWSHSAVEFLKYRRLLPMLVSDEHTAQVAFDEFDPFDQPSFSARTSKPDDKRVTVSNVSVRATNSQIQAFFTKFGKVHSCNFASEDRRQTMYATIPKHKKFCVVHITFKKEESAVKAKRAIPDELTFYGQQMSVSPYVSSGGRKRTSSINSTMSTSLGDDGLPNEASSTVVGAEGRFSRSSSMQSVASIGALSSSQQIPCALLLDELPTRVLERIFQFLDPVDRICLERVNKKWLEAAAKAWSNCHCLSFQQDGGHSDAARFQFFSKKNPLRNSHLRAFIQRCGLHLKVLDLSGAVNLLDEKAIEEIGQQCPNLIQLDISGVAATPSSLRSLSESLQMLKKVAYRRMQNVDDRHLWNLFKANAKTISSVDLRGCIRLRGRCFKLFGSDLEEVLLDGCRKIDHEFIEDICAHSNGLKTLSLNGCNKLTDESLSLISRNLLDLTRLGLSGDNFHGVTVNGLLQLCRLSSLRFLSFDYNSCVCDEFIEALVEGVGELQSLSIAFSGSDSTISKKSLLKLSNLKSLIELDVSGIGAVDNSLLKALSGSCKNLRQITARNCSYLGDEGVEALIELENVMHRIDLSGCIMVTSKSIQTLLNKFCTREKEDKSIPLPIINLIIGGTICKKKLIRIPSNSRVQLDFNDYSALNLNAAGNFLITYSKNEDGDECVDGEDMLDDEFNLLSAHRSFVADALNVEDDSPVLENDKSILEWAEREASQLGLFN